MRSLSIGLVKVTFIKAATARAKREGAFARNILAKSEVSLIAPDNIKIRINKITGNDIRQIVAGGNISVWKDMGCEPSDSTTLSAQNLLWCAEIFRRIDGKSGQLVILIAKQLFHSRDLLADCLSSHV